MEDKRLKLHIAKILKPLLGQRLFFGVNDCNLTFARIYYPEMAERIAGKYKTRKGGKIVAYRELEVKTVNEFLQQSDDWYECDNKYASFGDVFVNGDEITICLGKRSFSFDVEGFRQVPTQAVIGTLYKRVIK